MDILPLALIGPNENHGIFADAGIFVAWVLPSMPTLRHCPRQGTPNAGWLLGNKRMQITAFRRTSRLAIHLLFLNVQVRKSTGKWGERRGSR